MLKSFEAMEGLAMLIKRFLETNRTRKKSTNDLLEGGWCKGSHMLHLTDDFFYKCYVVK